MKEALIISAALILIPLVLKIFGVLKNWWWVGVPIIIVALFWVAVIVALASLIL